MRDGEKEYHIAKDAAASIGCHLPEEHIFHSTVANTPAFIREYFFLKGWIDCKKDSSFLKEENEWEETKRLKGGLVKDSHKTGGAK